MLYEVITPEIVVLDHHKQFSGHQFGFVVEHRLSDAFVVFIGSFVGTTDHNGFLLAIFRIAIR